MRLSLRVCLIAGAFPDVLFRSAPRKSEIATGSGAEWREEGVRGSGAQREKMDGVGGEEKRGR